jgi:hypothetical protein
LGPGIDGPTAEQVIENGQLASKRSPLSAQIAIGRIRLAKPARQKKTSSPRTRLTRVLFGRFEPATFLFPELKMDFCHLLDIFEQFVIHFCGAE